jgi:hypothetical protein
MAEGWALLNQGERSKIDLNDSSLPNTSRYETYPLENAHARRQWPDVRAEWYAKQTWPSLPFPIAGD